MNHVTRELTTADAVRYNEFLMQGVRRHPTTLRIAPADIEERPFVTTRTAHGVHLVVEHDGEWLGVGAVERELGRVKRHHVAWLVRMLVATPGHGIGRVLVRALIAAAETLESVEKLNLTVAEDNASGRALYTSEGFVTFAREVDAFRYDGQSVTELSMSRALRR